MNGIQEVRGSNPLRSTTGNQGGAHESPSSLIGEGDFSFIVNCRAAQISKPRWQREHMNTKYIPQEIEPKWHKLWAESGLYVTREVPDRQKLYFLTMLPYPSGDLHIGHWYAMTPSDAGARYRRMQGLQRLLPDRLRCIRPAGGERGHPARHPPLHVDDAQHRADARAAAQHGRDVGLGPRGGQLRPGILQVDAVVLPEAVRHGPGLSQEAPGRFLPDVQHDPGARAGRGRRPPLRALRHAGERRYWSSGSSRSRTMPTS